MSDQEFANFEIDLGEDFEKVNAWGGEQRLPPAGTGYHLTVEHIENTTIGNNTPTVAVTFVIADNEDVSLNGMKVWNNYPLTQKALGRLKQFMIAGGGSLAKFNASEYLGVTIAADIIHTESPGGVDASGQTREPRTFANVCNERPLEAPAKTETSAPTPPVMKGGKAAATGAAAGAAAGATTAKPNGSARRA